MVATPAEWRTMMATREEDHAALGAAELRRAYDVALATRASIVTCMNLKHRGAGVEFWIGGPGEEVHGTATAMALHEVVHRGSEPTELAFFLHYRSDAIAAMTYELAGRDDFVRGYFRQALSRSTDPHSGGRQMVMHLCAPEVGIWPMASPLGMQLGRAAGYARGLKLKGERGLVVAVVGDGTSGESDFHEMATAAGLWELPLLVIVTDNRIAISVTPDEGRGIKSFERYAQAFGLGYSACDGHDFFDTYETTRRAAGDVLDTGRPGLLVARVPRLMGHSSSSGGQFDFEERDPLLEHGERLLEAGILDDEEVFRRIGVDRRESYFELHRLGSRMEAQLERVRVIAADVQAEPAPSPEAGDLRRHVRPAFPEVREPESTESRPTRLAMNEALNLALARILERGDAAVWGQDVGALGGVFQVTAGLAERFGERVQNAPINEPMIVGTALGAALHEDLRVLPEIQFGDYSLNCLHWFVQLGNLHWATNGRITVNVTVRIPVDPVQGGAIYHSMSVDGFYGNVPGLVITTPSTSRDAYGLLRTAADYRGPVLQLEPKRLYRMRLGSALPGEPADDEELRRLRRAGEPLPVTDFRVPLGKAARRREGSDLTIVSWGWAAHQAVAAAERAAAEAGIEAEVWDLRTLVPYDREAVIESAQRTGRVLVAQSDRTFAGFGRQIQGDLVEALPGVLVRVVGQLDVPAVAQSRILEDATTLSEERLYGALRELADEEPAAWLDNELHWLRYAPSRSLA